MKLERMTEIETNDIHVGDRIRVDHYTATCQEITPKGALFLLDQYLDEAYPMNAEDTNRGGYPESDLRETLRSKEILDIFKSIRDYMVPFENGDLLRIPFFGEIFGQEDAEYFEPDGCEQWELMKDRKNRIAFRQNCWEWGWLQNKRKGSATSFCGVNFTGYALAWSASDVIGVRPVFQISLKKDDTTKNSAPENEETIRDVLDTFNEKQRLLLYYIVGNKIENEETILDVLDTLNEKQRLVLNYLVGEAVKDAKKGKTSESDEDGNHDDTARVRSQS